MSNKNIIFYIVGGLMALLLIIYTGYLLNFLVGQLSVVSGSDVGQGSGVVRFNLEKFEELGK